MAEARAPCIVNACNSDFQYDRVQPERVHALPAVEEEPLDEDSLLVQYAPVNRIEMQEERQESWDSDYTEEDESSQLTHNGHSKSKAWWRKGAFLALIAVVSAALLLSMIGSQGGLDTSSHGVFDSPQFGEVLREQIQSAFGYEFSEEQLHGHVYQTVRHLKDMAEKNLPQDQAEALKHASITEQNWADVQMALRATWNGQVRGVGKIALDVIKKNSFQSQEVMAQQLIQALKPQAQNLMHLRSEIVPARLDGVLVAWSKERDESQRKWKGLLNPTALEPVQGKPLLNHVDRRLQSGEFLHGKTFGIMSVILAAACEIILHLQMFIPKFTMPQWFWQMVMTGLEGDAVAVCGNGKNKWCDIILGILGLEVLDGFFLDICEEYLIMFAPDAAEKCIEQLDQASAEKQRMQVLEVSASKAAKEADSGLPDRL